MGCIGCMCITPDTKGRGLRGFIDVLHRWAGCQIQFVFVLRRVCGGYAWDLIDEHLRAEVTAAEGLRCTGAKSGLILVVVREVEKVFSCHLPSSGSPERQDRKSTRLNSS